MSRTVSEVRTTSVRYRAEPMGRSRENGPHLADMRAFVAECEGLPDELVVRIDNGSLDEAGRRTVTLSVEMRQNLDAAPGAVQDTQQ